MPFYDPLMLRLSLRERLVYGMDDFGLNLTLCIGMLYLLKFYTDELEMPAYYGGIIFPVAKFFTTFTDTLIGVLLDSRCNIGAKGKFRFFILYASSPVVVVASARLLATDSTLTVRTELVTILFMLFGLFYSLMNCSYGAIAPAITKNLHERAQLAVWHRGNATVSLLLCIIGFIPIQTLFISPSSLGYLVAASIFSVYGLFSIWWCFGGVKERYIEIVPDHHEPSIPKSFCAIFRNPPLLVLYVASLCALAAFNIKLAIQVYYTQYVLNDIHLLSWTGSFNMGCILVGMLLAPVAVKRFGRKQVYLGGLTLWAIDDVLSFLWGNTSFLSVAFSCMAFFGTAFVSSLSWALVPDTVDYDEWKTGIRAEGSAYTSYTFSRKIPAAPAGFLPGAMLTQIGYIPNITQSDAALLGLYQLALLWPYRLAIIATFAMGLFYKLNEIHSAFIIKEISQRKKNNTLPNPVTTKNNTSVVNV